MAQFGSMIYLLKITYPDGLVEGNMLAFNQFGETNCPQSNMYYTFKNTLGSSTYVET